MHLGCAQKSVELRARIRVKRERERRAREAVVERVRSVVRVNWKEGKEGRGSR